MLHDFSSHTPAHGEDPKRRVLPPKLRHRVQRSPLRSTTLSTLLCVRTLTRPHSTDPLRPNGAQYVIVHRRAMIGSTSSVCSPSGIYSKLSVLLSFLHKIHARCLYVRKHIDEGTTKRKNRHAEVLPTNKSKAPQDESPSL